MDDSKTRGEILRRYFKTLGISQREAAGRIGISAPHLSNILSGADNLGYIVVKKIVTAFPEIDPGYLLSGEGVLCPPPGSVRVHLGQRVSGTGNIVNGAGTQTITGDAALAMENAQLRDQLEQAKAEKDRLLGIIETLTKK